MSLVQTAIVEGIRGAIRLLASVLVAKDRRLIVLERRAKALSLFKDLTAVGLRPRDLRAIERTLTDD